ncbi:MAG: DUF4136 domain-containing protein [bacterium]|nr:DUF4136 domain-containing protein [bacterium]
MRKALGLGLVMALAAIGCSSITAHVDYDRTVDMDSYKTFTYQTTPDTSMEDTSPLMHRHVVAAIERKLTEGGMQKVDDNPDLYVTYHTAEREELRVNSNHYGYGYGGGWGWDPYWGGRYGGMGMGGTSTTVTQYTKGTLIIDVWDASTKNIIFRGTAESVVKENPEKSKAQIDASLDKISEEFRKKRAKEGM